MELFYFQWQETYEFAFEGQECHLGSGREIFPRTCGLANGRVPSLRATLQDFVDKVEYQPSGTYPTPKR